MFLKNQAKNFANDANKPFNLEAPNLSSIPLQVDTTVTLTFLKSKNHYH